ncbi:muconolactone Delta-isomerase family protein [Candidatus Methanomassiliicoccus intestinalis]|uniref:muconolactone Delta-isomerase family protein n=1 Tax=Candidatus Methanomassiliicoccus intestinalis TaxID=1406512 RepID=UPI0037DD6FA1
MEQYLVMFKLREESYGGSEEEAAFMLSDQIIPSLERLSEIESGNGVMGGFIEGQRSGAFIFSVKDYEELDKTLASLPIMNVYDVDVAPLQTISSALDRDRNIVGEVKKAAGL